MKNNLWSALLLFFYISSSFAQSSLNGYKYVVIPKKYDFSKEEDKYQLNSLTEFLFSKYGFNTMFEGESYTDELVQNPCLALKADVINDSGIFTTKFTVVLKDCYNRIVFTSDMGKSREKIIKKAYHEALRSAFISIENLNYHYDPSLEIQSNVVPEIVSVTATESKVSQPTKNQTPQNKEAKFYHNENISFFLVEQNDGFVAYINDSKEGNFKKGEKLGSLHKTSLPNVYRITWKNKDGDFKETTGYFDEVGNLKIDVNHDGKIEVIIFKIEN